MGIELKKFDTRLQAEGPEVLIVQKNIIKQRDPHAGEIKTKMKKTKST